MKRLDIVNDEEMLVHQKVSYLFILHYELIFDLGNSYLFVVLKCVDGSI